MFNKRDFILHEKGVLSQLDCDYIINFFETNPEMHVLGTAGGGDIVNEEYKKDTEIVLNINDSFNLRSIIVSGLNRCLKKYIKEYSGIELVRSWSLFELYKIQRYYPGEGYFQLHCENVGPTEEETALPEKRILAWMIYLNDVKDGGHTSFPSQKRKFQPRRGDVLIWPAYFTHPHRGIVSKTQTKYIISGWYSFT